MRDPKDAFPNYEVEIERKVAGNRATLEAQGVQYDKRVVDLLATEDEVLEIARWAATESSSTAILDITAFPKRFFCLLLKRLLVTEHIRNVVVTYTEAGAAGYAEGHLAQDPLAADHLPGFAPRIESGEETLVVAVGFEALSVVSLLDVYRERRQRMRIVIPFPPNGEASRRTMGSIRQMLHGRPSDVDKGSIEVVASWDVEAVYRTLARWETDSQGLTLAPFGTKPHSLAMTLRAIEQDYGMYYTQPKSYNPDYSIGQNITWAYIVKWDAVSCFDRREHEV